MNKARIAKLQLAPQPTTVKAPQALRLGGTKPAADMEPGTYRVSCIGAAVSPGRVDLFFQVIDGPHTGTALPMWIPTPTKGEPVMPYSRLAKECEVALGRPLDTSDDLNNPNSIFKGRHFLGDVAWRKTEKPKGGRNAPNLGFDRYWKDEEDGLRVHALLSLVEL